MALLIFVFLLLASKLDQINGILNIFDIWPSGSRNIRRLIGSNCILIERGGVPPYYDCVGENI